VIALTSGDRLVVASHNQGKLVEIDALLAPFGIRTEGAAGLGLPEPEETGTSFAENACLKAEAAAQLTGCAALSDDSGLCVEALGGDPGIHSARWAGPAKDFRFAMQKIEAALVRSGARDRSAHFVCVLALAAPGAKTEIFEGRVFGSLVFPPRGERGFGYDPIFVPEGQRLTFGEMEPRRKHAMSHRAQAFAKFEASVLAGRLRV
jgi:XTP/dITP diphosphohydrolase